MKTILKVILLTILLFLALANDSFAQIQGASQTSSGSFYSLFGVGIPTDIGSSKEYGMGILGVSLDNTQSNSLQNPALWGKNTLTTASSGFNLSQYTASNGTNSNINALFEAGYLQITLPLLKEKLGLSASLYSVTRANYRFVTLDSAQVSGDDTINYASDIRGEGGINKLEFGIGWNLNKNISIGYAPALAFISQNNSQDVYFSESGYGSSNLDSKISGTALGHRFGVLFTFRKLFSERDRLSFGSAATLPLTIEAEEKITVNKQVEGQNQEVSLREPKKGEIKLPAEFKAGLTYYPSSRVNFSLEGLLEKWGDFESAFSTEDELMMMNDRYKVGFGGEYHPYRSGSDKFLSNFRYSLGVSYDSGHLTIQDQEINTLWFSAGLGILSPSSRTSSSTDLSVRYGLRGTTTNSLIKENIWTFTISVNLSELMFYRKKLN